MTEPSERSALPARDYWLHAAMLVVVVGYSCLPFLRATGEGWGRGWNMVAYWIYSAPIVFLAGVVAVWRLKTGAASTKLPAGVTASAALIYPLVAFAVIRAK